MPPLTLTAWLRYDVIRRLIPPATRRILEIGVGVGSLGALLAERFEYVGVEPDPTSFEIARKQIGTSGRLVHGTAHDLGTMEPFDLICAFEVLEHLEDDRHALAEWLRFLRPGGWALVSVPHGRHKFGPQDRWVGHYRRYDRADVTHLLDEVGLREVTVVSYGFPLGNALEVVRNGLARRELLDSSPRSRTAMSGRWLQPPGWASIPLRGLTLPFRLAQRPFARTTLGSGLVARARLPE